MSEDKITCALCGLTWTVPDNLELNKENSEKFKCLCQRPLGLGYHFIRCRTHNLGAWIRSVNQWRCPECKNEEERSKAAKYTTPKFERYPHTLSSTPYEIEQWLKNLEATKT